MTVYQFHPNFHIEKSFRGVYPIKDLEKEVGVYSATPSFVREHCGPIANNILDLVPESYYEEAASLGLFPNIDVRIHRLYPGDYPAYPGWHCDGEYRETYFSQPDMHKVKVSKHIIATASSHEDGISNTQFLDDSLTYNTDREFNSEHTLWGTIHEILTKKCPEKLYDTKDGQLVMFDSWTLHRAMPTRIRGWRLFFRMAMWHKPNLGEGKISKQEQVYKLVEGSGW